MPHWTYDASVDSTADLEQGDIVQPSEALQQIFSRVHPHFRDAKYLGFLVATQSCDLVLRTGSSPKASYVNLATIRPLSHVVQKIISEVANPAAPGIFRSSAKNEVRRLLERILNQNEQAVGLFFLHEDADAGVGENSVAFLRVTVALRADHYETIRAARVGRLAPEFRAKLGWLIGNLYARPAAPDWEDRLGGKEKCDSLIRKYVDEVRWIDDEIIARAKLEQLDIAEATAEALHALRPPPKVELALSEVEEQLKKVAPDFDPGVVSKLQNRLRNSGKFTKLFK